MWCQLCQQDVPAIALAASDTGETHFCCARCNQLFDDESNTSIEYDATELAMADQDAIAEVSSLPPVDVDSWDMDLDSVDAAHLLATSMSSRTTTTRVQNPAHDIASDWHLGGMLAPVAARAQQKSRPPSVTATKPRTSLIGWLLMLCGVTAFVCGGVLMGMSLAQGRSELWRMGLPLALVGQGGLLVGLVFQLERVWQSHRKANARLVEVDEHVADLQTTADLLGTTHSGPSQAFYHHMAGGANTEMMLADLKGQIDMLSVQMAGRR